MRVSADNPMVAAQLKREADKYVDDLNRKNGGPLAHLAERRADNPEVGGSMPSRPTKKRGMNKLEMEYAGELEWKAGNQKIISFKYEAVTFKVADDTRYTPDFMIVHLNGIIEFVEIKGSHCWEDSWIKYKVTREMFSCFCWRWRQKLKTGWIEK